MAAIVTGRRRSRRWGMDDKPTMADETRALMARRVLLRQLAIMSCINSPAQCGHIKQQSLVWATMCVLQLDSKQRWRQAISQEAVRRIPCCGRKRSTAVTGRRLPHHGAIIYRYIVCSRAHGWLATKEACPRSYPPCCWGKDGDWEKGVSYYAKQDPEPRRGRLRAPVLEHRPARPSPALQRLAR